MQNNFYTRYKCIIISTSLFHYVQIEIYKESLINKVNSILFFFSSRRRHTISTRDWSSDVCSSDLSALYGGTVNQLKHLLRKMNVELTWVDPDDPDAWRQAVRPTTKAFFGETIGNPAGNVLDIETLATIAHEHELPLIVDNTFATPYLCRPIEWGADIVIHSATKFIGGHGTSIG